MEKRDDLADEAQTCSEQGNGYPLCQPVPTDTWMNGTSHQIIWNFNYPYYVTSNTINLYLYNIIKYNYVSIKNYTNIDTSLGGLQVQVDDSWFVDSLTAGSNNESITMYLYILPSDVDPYLELANSKSMYPRPFNFTALQIAPPSNGTTTLNGSPNNNNNNNNGSITNNSSKLPGWAIAVICIAVFAILFGTIALIWTMMIIRRNKRRNQDNKINTTTTGGGASRFPSMKKIITKDPGYYRSTDSVHHLMQSASSVGTSPSVIIKSPLPVYDQYTTTTPVNQKTQLTPAEEVIFFPERFKDWNENEEEEELRRRRLGESLLQRQLEEDGTSVKHAGRFTRVKSVAELPKSAAMVEHPRYP